MDPITAQLAMSAADPRGDGQTFITLYVIYFAIEDEVEERASQLVEGTEIPPLGVDFWDGKGRRWNNQHPQTLLNDSLGSRVVSRIQLMAFVAAINRLKMKSGGYVLDDAAQKCLISMALQAAQV